LLITGRREDGGERSIGGRHFSDKALARAAGKLRVPRGQMVKQTVILQLAVHMEEKKTREKENRETRGNKTERKIYKVGKNEKKRKESNKMAKARWKKHLSLP